MSNRNPLSTPNIDDIEIVLKRVFESKKEICEILQETYTPIDPSLSYENITTECRSIANTPIAARAVPDETLDLDKFEEVFKNMDRIDRELSAPKASVNINVARVRPKMPRCSSAFTLDQTGLPGLSNTTLNPGMLRGPNLTMMHNSTMCLNTTMAQPEPMNMQNLVRVTNETISEFNAIKIVSMEELQKKRITSELRAILTNFTASIKKLKEFSEKIKKHGKNTNSKEEVVPLANLNAEFCDNLKKLAKSLEDVRSIEDKREMFSVTKNMPELVLPLSDYLMDIIQKYSYGQWQ